jgi:hypothetical protein
VSLRGISVRLVGKRNQYPRGPSGLRASVRYFSHRGSSNSRVLIVLLVLHDGALSIEVLYKQEGMSVLYNIIYNIIKYLIVVSSFGTGAETHRMEHDVSHAYYMNCPIVSVPESSPSILKQYVL